MTKVSVCELKFIEFDVDGRMIRALGTAKRVQDADWPVEGNYD